MLLYMTMLLFGGMASAFLRGAQFTFHRCQCLYFGSKCMEDMPVYIIVHKIALLLTDQKSSIT